MAVHYQGGKRERRRFSSLEAARSAADRLKVLLLNQDLVALQVTGQDLVVYQRVKAKADQLGLSLDSLTNEFSEARKMLGETSILEAALPLTRLSTNSAPMQPLEVQTTVLTHI